MTEVTLGKRLRKAREQAKLTQEEAAQQLGITNVVLSRYENDRRRPDPETMRKLADCYRVSLDYLFGRQIGNGTDDTQIFLRATKLTPEGKQKLMEFLEMVETWEKEHKAKKE